MLDHLSRVDLDAHCDWFCAFALMPLPYVEAHLDDLESLGMGCTMTMMHRLLQWRMRLFNAMPEVVDA